MSGPFGSSQWMYKSGGYEIDNSLRFDSASSAKLTNTFASAGNRRTFSFSTWVKRSTVSGYNVLFGIEEAADGSAENLLFFDTTSGNIRFGWNDYTRSSAAFFRDISGWYHVLLAVDTTDATAQDRIKMYVNGVQITVWAASSNNHPDEDEQFLINKASEHHIGVFPRISTFANVYMAETHFIDGAAKTPADFGEVGDYGEFKPIEYDGTYGDEGFYLDFKSSGVGTASDSTIGADRSGNTNHWSSTNIAATDQMVDTPTNNFCTWNPLQPDMTVVAATRTFSEGNLKILTTGTAGADARVFGTMGVSSGKWYFEWVMTVDAAGVGSAIGVADEDHSDEMAYYGPHGGGTGGKHFDGGSASYGAAWAVGDIIGIAFNADTNAITFYKNGSSQGEITSAVDGGQDYFPFVWDGSGSPVITGVVNFGQDSSFAGTETAQGNQDGNGIGDFYYAPPTGFLALCTSNLPDAAVTPSENFNTVLYTGNGSTQDIAVGYNPDFVWIKNRSQNDAHQVFNSFTGATYAMHMDGAEIAVANDDTLTAFASTGFSLGDDVVVNTNSESYVSWNWNFGNTTLGTGAFTQGSIASTCKRNLSAGMSLVQYTGTEANGTVGHGLSQAPDMFFTKCTTAQGGWGMFHKGLGGTHVIAMNLPDGKVDEAEIFQDTAPSATVLTVGDTTYNNDDGETTLAWCFHAVPGFSEFGSYNGNNNINGGFFYCGFRPAWVLIKSTVSGSTPWMLFDSKRDIFNPSKLYLQPEAVNAEGSSSQHVDFLSNGFKIRYAGGDMNTTNEHIWMAFAETPFKYANGR